MLIFDLVQKLEVLEWALVLVGAWGIELDIHLLRIALLLLLLVQRHSLHLHTASIHRIVGGSRLVGHTLRTGRKVVAVVAVAAGEGQKELIDLVEIRMLQG